MQEWFRRLHPGRSPYRLYALSNLGSLLALITYPFLFEPNLTRKTQATIWACGLGLFVILCGWCALRLWKGKFTETLTEANEGNEESAKEGAQIRDVGKLLPAEAGDPSGTPTLVGTSPKSQIVNRKSQILLWLLLPACAS